LKEKSWVFTSEAYCRPLRLARHFVLFFSSMTIKLLFIQHISVQKIQEVLGGLTGKHVE
jgi:hypothetical protein